MKMSQPGLAVAVVPVKAWDIRARHYCFGLPRTSGLLKLALLSGRLTGQNESQVQTALPLPRPAQECLHGSSKWITKPLVYNDIN